MHPAPSVIVFTVASGLGFGLLAFLGLGWPVPAPGLPAFLHWGLGYLLAAGGLVASTFHLGHPERAWRAFSQWRSSWLSREGVAAVAALVLLAPTALSDWLDLGLTRLPGQAGAVLAALTVLATSMIYTQLSSVPRWHHWSTPPVFLGFALAGGALLAGRTWVALPALVGLGLLLAWVFADGETRFARAGQTTGTATGLGRIGRTRVLEQPHSGPNYLMREMIHIVGRRHARKLQALSLVLAAALPAAIVALVLAGVLPALAGLALAGVLHMAGALAQRWLFFAQAEHVVGLYYGKR
ncbi:MAG: dimethyl sulfoxide reductase anchor subunit [Rhodobacteraceae bacterium]|nr:dimethyl sulfoxide reductase anchor subunit [Paracoccaceae bacterium]